MPPKPTRFSKAYFDKWYRSPTHRVHTRAEVERKIRMVVGVTEMLLERPVRTVLDVGCGEAAWQPVLKKMRPNVHYTGVDPSEYAVRRFGRRRNILLGTFADLDVLELDGSYDLIVCCDFLNYVSTAELTRGVGHVTSLLGGLAYLEVYTAQDEVEGDVRGWHRRPTRWYRKFFERMGLTACGMHCYVGDGLRDRTVALERAG